MISTRTLVDQTWTDITSPTEEELGSLIFTQNIDPSIAKDLLTPSPKQGVKEVNDTLYVIFHIPSFRHSQSVNIEQEVDCVITKSSLVTARYESIDALHHFSKQLEVSEILNKINDSHLFFGMMKEVYAFLFDEIDYIKDWMRSIEKSIFEGREQAMVFDISSVSRNLLGFKRVIGPHEIAWRNLEILGREHFGNKFGKDAKFLLEEWERLNTDIKNMFDMLDELRETNNSILTTKQNEIMKTFTILAFMAFPLSLIASIFGMNSDHMPIIGQNGDFWIIISIMLSVSLAMFTYFKYKKWI